MKSNFLYLIRLRSHWRRSSISAAAHGLTGQRAFRLGVEWCDGPQLPVKITHSCGGFQARHRNGDRGIGVPATPPRLKLAREAPRITSPRSGHPSTASIRISFSIDSLHICKPSESSRPFLSGLLPTEQSGVERCRGSKTEQTTD